MNAALTPGTYWTAVALLAAMVLVFAGGLFLEWREEERPWREYRRKEEAQRREIEERARPGR